MNEAISTSWNNRKVHRRIMVVINAGFPGENTRDLLKRFSGMQLSRTPDCVVLLLGTNDMLNSYNETGEKEFSVHLEELAKRCTALPALLILCEIPQAYQPYMERRHKPGFFETCSAAMRVQKANRVIGNLARHLGVPLIPTAELLGAPGEDPASLIRNIANSDAEDGVHPTAQGYGKLAAAVAEVIEKLPRKPQTVLCLGDSITFGVHMRGAGTAAPDADCYPGQLARLLNQSDAAARRPSNES